jgi:hypothetical protein
MASHSRLVASTLDEPPVANIASTNSAQASIRCSQLSKTINID